MSLIKTIDSKLMRILTFNFRYPDWSKAPLSFALSIVFVHLLMAALYIFSPMFFGGKIKLLDWVIASIWLILAFYHFRIWLRLKSERTK